MMFLFKESNNLKTLWPVPKKKKRRGEKKSPRISHGFLAPHYWLFWKQLSAHFKTTEFGIRAQSSVH
jgi:hypothetical protein